MSKSISEIGQKSVTCVRRDAKVACRYSNRSAPWHCLRVSILTVLQLRRFARPVPRSRSTAARCFSQQRQPVVRAFHQQLCDGLACFGLAGPRWKLESLRPIEWVPDQHGLGVASPTCARASPPCRKSR
jgi:hypothetical protein